MNEDEIIEEIVEIKKELPELTAGELFLKDKDPFATTIDLKGKQLIPDTFIFRPRESRAIIKGDYMIMKNLGGNHPFLLFSNPELKYMDSFGRYGNGPGEFVFPDLVPTNDPSLLAYLYESTKEKLYQLTREGNIIEYEFSLTSSKDDFNGKENNIVNVGKDDFIFVDNSSTSKSIFRTRTENDSIHYREVYSLQLNPKRKSPFNYIGDFAVNPGCNRMVYAYKYFKIIKFMDLEANTVKTLNFQQVEFEERTLSLGGDGLDQNVTHYWGMCAQDEYVYLLYSGRTPSEVMKEWQKGERYIYVEKYDWNGTPVAKYRLDEWGYFTVDEKNNRLLLISTNLDDPFIEYDLL